MKSSNRFALLATVVVALSSLSSVAIAATATGNANATVLAPIAITAPTALSFGSFSGGLAIGTVVVATTGSARSATNALLSSSLPGVSGKFTVTGANLSFSIAAPATVTLTGPGPSMVVTLSGLGNGAGSSGVISGGTVDIPFGGSLAVGTGLTQTAGTYVGSFPMTVEYN